MLISLVFFQPTWKSSFPRPSPAGPRSLTSRTRSWSGWCSACWGGSTTASGSCSVPWRSLTPSAPRPCRMPLICWHPWGKSGPCCRCGWGRRRRSWWSTDWGECWRHGPVAVAGLRWTHVNAVTECRDLTVTSWTTRFSTNTLIWWESWGCTRPSWRSWSTCWAETSHRWVCVGDFKSDK